MISMERTEYVIGHAKDEFGEPIWIGYRPTGPAWKPGPAVCVQIGIGPTGESFVRTPQEMLNFKPHTHDSSDGRMESAPSGQDSPIWFQCKCKQAGCEWFASLVIRMAAGENVPLEEIEALYVAQNGQAIPQGRWSRLFIMPNN